jgi:hypothetical protein
MGIASVQPFDFSTLKPEGKIGIPSKGASSFFTQIGIVGCYGGCIDIGVAFDDYSPHFTVSFGYGTEIGWSGYASTGPGRVRSGWNAGASCSCAIGYAGYTVDNYGTTPFAGANFPAATRFGCATMFGYTF